MADLLRQMIGNLVQGDSFSLGVKLAIVKLSGQEVTPDKLDGAVSDYLTDRIVQVIGIRIKLGKIEKMYSELSEEVNSISNSNNPDYTQYRQKVRALDRALTKVFLLIDVVQAKIKKITEVMELAGSDEHLHKKSM